MTRHQLLVKELMLNYGQTVNTTPTIPRYETRKLRARLILEEAVETIEALGFSVECKLNPEGEINNTFISLEEIADGCADLEVVTIGTALACGLQRPCYEPDEIFEEVMRSNMTKFWPSHMYEEAAILYPDSKVTYLYHLNSFYLIDKYGKFIKPPTHQKPNIKKYV